MVTGHTCHMATSFRKEMSQKQQNTQGSVVAPNCPTSALTNGHRSAQHVIHNNDFKYLSSRDFLTWVHPTSSSSIYTLDDIKRKHTKSIEHAQGIFAKSHGA